MIQCFMGLRKRALDSTQTCTEQHGAGRPEGTLVTDPLTHRSARRALFVEVRVQDDEGVYVYKARNLSVGGMFIDSPVPAAPGTVLHIGFDLPGLGRVSCRGEVRWNTDVAAGRARHPGMGVAFVALDDTVRELIDVFTAAEQR